MSKRITCIAKTIRKELFRAVLERLQGEGINSAMNKNESDVCKNDLPYDVEETLNQPYMNRQEVPLAMDVFKPVTEENRELPVIVTIHGGGLVAGDRKISRSFNRILAGHGYLVFSVEYRLAPRANCAQQLDDVCAGMDLIGRELVNYDVDFSRVFLIAESAGAYLATYVTAMRGSEELQKAIGYKPSKMVFKGIGLIGGMFYTQKMDPIGLLLSEQFYGDMENSEQFLKYMDPENPEILKNLPPAYLITSRGDFLNNYTLMFHDALKKEGKKTHLLYYGDKALTHAFVAIHPQFEKSEDAIKKMLAWFEEEAAPVSAKAEEGAAPEPAKTKEETAPKPAKTKEETAPKPAKTKEETAPEPAETEGGTASEVVKAGETAASESVSSGETAASEPVSSGETAASEPAKAEDETAPEPVKKPRRGRRKKTETDSNQVQA